MALWIPLNRCRTHQFKALTFHQLTLSPLPDPLPPLRTHQLKTFQICLLTDQLLVSNIVLVPLHMHHTHNQHDGGHGEDSDNEQDDSSPPYEYFLLHLSPVHPLMTLTISKDTLYTKCSLIPCMVHGTITDKLLLRYYLHRSIIYTIHCLSYA